MSRFDQDLVLPPSLSDYAASRERTIEAYRSALKTLALADQEFQRIYSHGLPRNSYPRDSLEETIRAIDRRLWHQAFDITGFGQLMDRQARKDFERTLEQNPPAFTVENVRSIFLSTAQDADEMFNRGLVNVFRRLSRSHRTNTNNAFKINRRAIIEGMVRPSWGGGLEVRIGWPSDELNDIDRVIKTLDRQPHHRRALETAVNGALKKREVYEDAYYQIKGFANSNMHILFKRQDLLDQANRIIHDYYEGSALAKNGTSSAA